MSYLFCTHKSISKRYIIRIFFKIRDSALERVNEQERKMSVKNWLIKLLWKKEWERSEKKKRKREKRKNAQ